MRIDTIEIQPGACALWHDASAGEAGRPAFCIHCHRCLHYGEDQDAAFRLAQFHTDSNVQVCPTGALSWNSEDESPKINHDKCILCGACLAQCPVKALYLAKQKVCISHERSSPIPRLENFLTARLRGSYAQPSVELADTIYTRIQEGWKDNRFTPNILARNVLISLGWSAIAHKTGVQYTSLDVVGTQDATYLAAEVELDNQMIDLPRNLITYLPLLVERHGLPRNKIRLLAIGMSLPSHREEYWNVLEDIDAVLDLKINTASIVYLILCVLARKPLFLQDDALYLPDTRSCRDVPDEFEDIPVGHRGILEPAK